jgi:hypothetical protein
MEDDNSTLLALLYHVDTGDIDWIQQYDPAKLLRLIDLYPGMEHLHTFIYTAEILLLNDINSNELYLEDLLFVDMLRYSLECELEDIVKLALSCVDTLVKVHLHTINQLIGIKPLAAVLKIQKSYLSRQAMNLMLQIVEDEFRPEFMDVLMDIFAEIGPSYGVDSTRDYDSGLFKPACSIVHEMLDKVDPELVPEELVKELTYRFKHVMYVSHRGLCHFSCLNILVRAHKWRSVIREILTPHDLERLLSYRPTPFFKYYCHVILLFINLMIAKPTIYPYNHVECEHLIRIAETVLTERALAVTHDTFILYSRASAHIIVHHENRDDFLLRLFGLATCPFLINHVAALIYYFWRKKEHYAETLRKIADARICTKMLDPECVNVKVRNIIARNRLIDKFRRRVTIRPGELPYQAYLAQPARLATQTAINLLNQLLDSGTQTSFVIKALELLSSVMVITDPPLQLCIKWKEFKQDLQNMMHVAIPDFGDHQNPIRVKVTDRLDTIAFAINQVSGDVALNNEYFDPISHYLKGDSERLLSSTYPQSLLLHHKINWLFTVKRIPGAWSIIDLFSCKQPVVNTIKEREDQPTPEEPRTTLTLRLLPQIYYGDAILWITPNHHRVISRFARSFIHLYDKLEKKQDYSAFTQIEYLSDQMFLNRFSYPRESLLFQSESVEFVHRHPRWFDTRTRLYAFLMRNLPFSMRLHTYLSCFARDAAKEYCILDLLQLRVDPHEILESGSEVLEKFAANSIPVDISTSSATYPASTLRFLGSFARALRPAIFHVQDTNGLFPNVAITQRQMRLFGVYLARVLYMDSRSPLKLNPYFFTLMRGPSSFDINYAQLDAEADRTADARLEEIMDDINPELHVRLLLDSFVGSSFIYPGTGALMMTLEVDAVHDPESQDLYTYLAKSYTCGKYFRNRMRGPFIEGFNSVFVNNECNPLDRVVGFEELCTLFNDEELSALFCGDERLFMEEDFDYIHLENTYTNTEHYLEWFKGIVLNLNPAQQRMLLIFITGSCFLPVGGARYLYPTMFIAKSQEGTQEETDRSLITGHTQSHTLFLPTYSSFGIMEKQIIQALTTEKRD